MSELDVSGERPVARVGAEKRVRGGLRWPTTTIAVVGGLVLAAATVAVVRKNFTKSPGAAPWHATVSAVDRLGGEGDAALTVDGKPEGSGFEVSGGAALETSPRARASLGLDEGILLTLDRATRASLAVEPRTLKLETGQIALAAEGGGEGQALRIVTPRGDVVARSARLVVTATHERTTVQVLRGQASLLASGDAIEVASGEEGVAPVSGRPFVSAVGDLGRSLSLGERTSASPTSVALPTEASAGGLGELVARRPGRSDEKDRALRLASHLVKIRVAANVARTEVEEVFENDTDDDLEGVYRFAMPAGAEVEDLALDVDGKLVPGSFVEKGRAAAIWRGAIQNAAPKPQKQEEEIVWVPGPWRDPALLEWNGGGRFELKIFPIPRHGSRRVQLAYTETVPEVAGTRRYTYPLPDKTSAVRVGRFAVDAQVRGVDGERGVHVTGYDLRASSTPSGVQLTGAYDAFVPSGDLALEYALEADHDADVTAWAYRDPAPQPGADANPYVALAIRPRLPRWQTEAFRDQVIVVDAGHSMTGERFRQATRLAAEMAKEMDRRDRVTVLACDVSCTAMLTGFLAPGPEAATAVATFLGKVSPDGATDLVNAIRAGSAVSGRAPDHDLRVVLLSSGVAGSGVRRADRLEQEVVATLREANAEVLTVPIGADADGGTLSAVARGGGGVMVPFVAGRSIDATALAALAASYGATLRDAQLTLPDGLYGAAPAVLAPLRAGAEQVVAARMNGESVSGEAVLRGKVAGRPFEARYPLTIRASSEPGNAFLPRMYASQRVAALERTGGDEARPELVKLSQRYAVPTRFTSLLVLESEAMFQAFGIDRTRHASEFTGENEAVASVTRSPKAPPADNASAGKDALDRDDAFGAGDLEGSSGASAFGGGGRASASEEAKKEARRMAPTSASRPMADAQFAPAAPPAPAHARPVATSRPVEPSRAPVGRWMKREWFRTSAVRASSPPVSAEKIAAARAAVLASPDERARYKELAKLLAQDGSLSELGEVVARWAARDPLDPDAIAARADVLSRQGQRDASLRVLSGLLGGVTKPKNELELARTLALDYARAGKQEACSFWRTAAELAPAELDLVAHAAACERATGQSALADRWLSALKTDAARDKAIELVLGYEQRQLSGESPPEKATGDLVLDATWDGNQDLDLVVVDPAGNRYAWSSRAVGVRVVDARSKRHETLALSSWSGGPFMVEVVRTEGAEDASPVVGTVRIRSLGSSSTKSFELVGPRAEVARVDVSWESRLVPAEAPVL